MSTRNLTCIECPIGCQIEVEVVDGKPITIMGNSCPRGKLYAENEIICPKRVVTSTVKADNGQMLPVKTDKPVKKSEMFEIMEKINAVVCKTPVKIGEVLVKNISEDANLVATGNLE